MKVWIDHDDGHAGGYPHDCHRCECGWYPRPGVYGGETMAEHQVWCRVHGRPAVAAWFKRWFDAYHQAAFRADITGRRYRVHYDPANRWWNITELTKRHRSS